MEGGCIQFGLKEPSCLIRKRPHVFRKPHKKRSGRCGSKASEKRLGAFSDAENVKIRSMRREPVTVLGFFCDAKQNVAERTIYV